MQHSTHLSFFTIKLRWEARKLILLGNNYQLCNTALNSSHLCNTALSEVGAMSEIYEISHIFDKVRTGKIERYLNP